MRVCFELQDYFTLIQIIMTKSCLRMILISSHPFFNPVILQSFRICRSFVYRFLFYQGKKLRFHNYFFPCGYNRSQK